MHLADGKFNAYQRTYILTDFLTDRQFLNVSIGNELPSKIQEEVRESGIPYIFEYAYRFNYSVSISN